MTTALAVQQTNVAHLGNRLEIEAVQKRIMSMMPGAKNAPSEVVWAAAQLAVAYRLDPFNGELYIMPVGRKQDANGAWGDEYRTHIGIKGQRKIARRKAEFNLSVREMSPEEVKRFRRDDYEPDDIGVEATVVRLDLARKFKDAGVQYTGSVGRGFWRVKAKYNKGEKKWDADNIPNTWTAYEVAEKRAEVNALKKAFDMDFDVADPAAVEDEDVVEIMATKVAEHDRSRAMVAERRNYIVEPDGDILMATDPIVGHRRPAPEPVDVEIEQIDEESGDMLLNIDDESGFWDDADQPVRDMVETLNTWATDFANSKMATDKQTEYAMKCLEIVTGKGEAGKFCYQVFGYEFIDEVIPLKLANWFFTLPQNKKQKADDGTWHTVANERYDADAVSMASAIWKYIQANQE